MANQLPKKPSKSKVTRGLIRYQNCDSGSTERYHWQHCSAAPTYFVTGCTVSRLFSRTIYVVRNMESCEIIDISNTNDSKDDNVGISNLVTKGRYYKQIYRTAWEDMPEFKGWLKGLAGQANRAYCTFCKKSLHAHRLSLLKHTCTIRHQKATQLHLNGPTQFVPETEMASGAAEEVTERDFYLVEETEADESGEKPETDEDTTIEKPGMPVYLLKQEARAAAVAASAQKPPISTHVLDTSRGQAVNGLQVSLYKLVDGRWTFINESATNPDGRCMDLMKRDGFTAGRYKLHFDVDKYFELRKQDSLYPFIEIVFDCRAPQEHYHIPLLLSPFGYSTYRGT